MRSVDHCVEALCSTNAHPFTDALALRSLGMLGRFLRECNADPSDLTARTHAHLAAWMSISGLANVNLGLSHGIGHQLGARCNVPHGVTSCVMLAPTMDFNREFTRDRQPWIAGALGTDVAGLSSDEACQAASDAVRALVVDLGLPNRLRDVGVTREDFPSIANDALQDIIVATNPNLEGEATAMYIARLIKPFGVRVTRLARGLPVGGDLEYADEVTLGRALSGRSEM